VEVCLWQNSGQKGHKLTAWAFFQAYGGTRQTLASGLRETSVSQAEGVIPMKHAKVSCRLLAAALLLSGMPTLNYGADQDSQKRDRMANESSITGCLNKDTSGSGFTITDEKTGVKTPVTGAADLEKHSANHKVTLTGTSKTEADGKAVFEVSKIQHVSTTCKAPSE
jgi:hypothetical protein